MNAHLPLTLARALAPMAPPQSVVHRAIRRVPTVDVELEYGLTLEVEYDYTPAEAPVYDVESPVCGPGCDESVEVCAAWIKGDPTRRDIWPILPIETREVVEDMTTAQVLA